MRNRWILGVAQVVADEGAQVLEEAQVVAETVGAQVRGKAQMIWLEAGL